MIEQSELEAASFWREFDRQCRNPQTDDESYERSCLWILFVYVYAERHGLRADQTHFSRGDASAVWQKVMRELQNAFDTYASGEVLMHTVDSRLLARGLSVLSRMSKHIDPAPFYDHRFLRVAERLTGLHRYHSYYSACLANALAVLTQNSLTLWRAQAS